MIKLIIVIQFAIELQWILRLVFSPMQLDFESAPFSHLGTSPNLGYYSSDTVKNQGFSALMGCLFASSSTSGIRDMISS